MATVPFKVKALYEYTSGHEDDLPFDVGQIITVTDVDDPDWYGGEYVDATGQTQEGIFPRNFVEKCEPTAPPRPARSRKEKTESVAAPPPEPEPMVEADSAAAEPEPEPKVVEDTRLASPPPLPPTEVRSPRASAAPASAPKALEPEPGLETLASVVPAPQAAEAAPAQPVKSAAPARSGPPLVVEKPSSFKDRIAAFNKPAAPPVAPFKPSGLSAGGSNFIKKPFVAPPPSRNAYVPPVRDVPVAKVYRRDEDPEIREREAEAQESAEKAGLAPATSQEGKDEDQPKPTSLKERIALLQKQQAEAAARHADSVAKKEKPKRPPKKRTDSEETQEVTSPSVTDIPPQLERRDTEEGVSRSSIDEPPPRQLSTRRKSSKGPPEDGNDADMSGAGDTTEGPEELTEKEDSDEKTKPIARVSTGLTAQSGKADDAEQEEEDEDDEEEDVDPEVKRKEELRARMAKMSGGMGFNMFGGPMAAPVPSGSVKKKKAAPSGERRSIEQAEEERSSRMAAPPVPTMMALPGMGQQKAKEEEAEPEELPQEEIAKPVTTTSARGVAPELPSRDPGAPPPVPGGRPAPPPVPAEPRPPPPPLAAGLTSPSVGSESDDELPESIMKGQIQTPKGGGPPTGRAPPPIPLASPPLPTSPRSPAGKRTSYAGEDVSTASPAMPPQPNKRNSRPPPIPGAPPPAPSQIRPPPPPPPGAPSSRTSTSHDRPMSPMKPGALDNGEEGELTEYEGDYDTDIASSVHHKEALKAHARDSSIEDTTPIRSPISEAPPPSMPPPIPSTAAPRAVPPPIPSQPPPNTRPSAEMPRAAPPPPPPPKTDSYNQDDDEYDPFNYAAPKQGVPLAAHNNSGCEEDSTPEPERPYQSPPPSSRAPPPAPPSNRAPTRQSLDVSRSSGARRSTDVGRPSTSMESGFVANDVDLANHTTWWLQPNGLPPVFQGRRDIFSESDESTSPGRGGKTEVTKEVYILFQDYSQTIIIARFDPQDPSNAELEQRHEPPPRSLRQDQLEQAYERYGMHIASAIISKKETVVGDGTPQGLIYELLKPFKDALLPVGTRAYGALVYANIANASTQTNDQIRPGDIISIRNAKFQGKHGPMHAKYSTEVGKPDHVAVVAEWDGTKKKVRAWEQGRESKKVKQESFKLDDLRSGEVKIWRVMPRSWVGWDSQN